MKTYLINLLIALFVTVVFACAEKDITNDPKLYYQSVKSAYDDKEYDMAIRQLGEFKSRYPYSQYAIEAELLIANSQFNLGNYDESAVSYETFVKLHPRHEQVPYALFKVGESYWSMSPEEIDREQIYAAKAISEWGKLLNQFPNDEYSKKAAELVQVGRKRIAQSEEFAAKFYCRKQIYHACAYRSIELVDKYSEFPDIRKDALIRSVQAVAELINQKEQDPDSDTNIYFNTMSVDELKKLLQDLQTKLTQAK